MFVVFDILFTIVPVVIIITVVAMVMAARTAKSNKQSKENDDFKEIYDKIEKESKQLDNDNLTDEEIEEELVKRFNSYSIDNKETTSSQANHDDSCNEKSCDGCGADDVYAQVYGKRKQNKLKKK